MDNENSENNMGGNAGGAQGGNETNAPIPPIMIEHMSQILSNLSSLSAAVEQLNQQHKKSAAEMQQLQAQVRSFNAVQNATLSGAETATGTTPSCNMQSASSVITSAVTTAISSPPLLSTPSCGTPFTATIASSSMFMQPAAISEAARDLSAVSSQTRHSVYVEDASRKMYPLPNFNGKAEEWPLFLTSFNSTTQEFGYSNAQNLLRLQRALQGEAKQAVVSLLIYPEDVPNVIEELQFNFGRPDIMVRSQINSVQEIQAISENNIAGIIALSNKVKNMVSLFKSANCSQHLMNPILIEQLVLKLPPSKQFEWGKYVCTQTCPSVEHFAHFMRELAKMVCVLPHTAMMSTGNRQNRNSTNQATTSSSQHSRRLLQTSYANNPVSTICVYCEQNHLLQDCSKFQQCSLADKWVQVKQQRLCISCLKKGHQISQCHNRKSCGIEGCTRPHHKLLHEQTKNAVNPLPGETKRVYNCTDKWNQHLFKIIPVLLRGPAGSIQVFAMFDDGSSVSLLEENIATKLGLKGQTTPLSLQWFDNQVKTEMSKHVSIDITGVDKGAITYTIKGVRTVKELDLPKQTLHKENYAHMKKLPIMNYENAKPVLLLGLDNCHLGVSDTVVGIGQHLPLATATKLGWLAFGPVFDEHANDNVRVCVGRQLPSMRTICTLMEEYISIENFGVRSSDFVVESDDNKRAKAILEKTTQKLEHQYETGLLWRSDNRQLPDSFEMAANRLLKVETKMKRDPNYAERYKQEMNKYLQKGYARMLSEKEAATTLPMVWYLPHFGVENPNKPNKLRIVFDAAAAVGKVSLNSMLLKGPEHALPLIGVLFKFREGIIGVAGDIQEMFSRVKIIDEDQQFQRFLWREGDSSRPMQQYVMTSMIFGAVCSPCCAEYIKNYNAKQHMPMMPKGAKAITNNMYVDDLVISFNDKEEARQVITEAIQINAAANFKLRNFVSNSNSLEAEFNQGEVVINTNEFQLERANKTDKILGLFWDKVDDSFRFQFKFQKIPAEVMNDSRAPTKREMLSIVMSIFDPFGFIANLTVLPKMLMQATWKNGILWDEQLPPNLHKQWQNWWYQFRQVDKFYIPRCLSPFLSSASDVQMHVFVDASASAYAAVVYLRIKQDEDIQVSFVAAKSRVAPTKGMTIPRLELQAAVLGCRLKIITMQSVTFKINSITFWSDSKTVVLWIRSSTREYKQFVSVRIAEVPSSSEIEQWRWLPSALNVADDATRPEMPLQADGNDRWVHGPPFLKEDEALWPAVCAFADATIEDEKSEHNEYLFLCKKQVPPIINFLKYSSFLHLLRVYAWMLRYTGNLRLEKSKRQSGELTAAEIKMAEKYLCMIVQREAFADEMAALESKGRVSKASSLYQLTPYIDNEGVMRVHGRIDNAYYLPFEVRRPIIMPFDHHVTKLIMRNFHENLHHQNDDLTLNKMRQTFWVPRVRSLLKQVKRACASCARYNAKPKTPLMGQLPEDRITPYLRPFSYAGVDYCGPFEVGIGRRREKRWVSLFTCLNTRAIHLEIAANLSADAFLICFRNFANRRGTPVLVRSDNGTNFVRAKKELTADSRLFDPDEIQKEMAKSKIEWIFNCPANPHAGGCWERLIRCVKRLLERTLKGDAPRLDTFNSILIEAESIINSRPLTELPLLPNQTEPLTPNHFLLGCTNSTQTPSADIKPCMRKQWKIAQNLKDRLWKRWTVEYLPQLLTRPKWHDKAVPLCEDQLVLIIDHTQPRSHWQTGRITQVFSAKDGQVRTAEVKTKNGLLRRPAAKLAVLNFCESFNSPTDPPGVEC